MKKLTDHLVCWGTLVAISLASTCLAAPIRYEPFDYVAGTVEGQTNPDGETWVRAYGTVATPVAPNSINIASGNLAVPPQIDPAVGNSAEIDGIGNGNGKAIRLPLGQGITSGTVYYSFALRVDALTGSNNSTGGFFIALNNSAGATTGDPSAAAAKVQARVDATDPSKYNLGIFNNRSTGVAASTSWSDAELNVGDTLFVVASYKINAGATNDVSRLWINPVLNGSEHAPTAIDTIPGGTDINIASILLRQSPAPHVTLDELRIGTDWDSVTIPEPASLALLLAGCALVYCRRRSR